MKTIRRKKTQLLAVLCVAAFSLGAAGAAWQVQVRGTPLRSQAHYLLGKKIRDLTYGEKLTEIRRAKGWVEVRLPDGTTGWVHESALTHSALRLKVTRGRNTAGTTENEMALAGRGFNREVESAYRRQGGQHDFATLDWVEDHLGFTPDQLATFRQQGELKLPEGNQ